MEHHTPSSAYVTSLIEAGLEAHQAGRFDSAEAFYREALTLDPAHAKALHYLGVLHHQRGQHALAAQMLSASLELDRTDAACWSNRGLVAAALGHPQEAMICYDQALQLQPDFADARNNFGVALQAQGALEIAVEQYRLALAANPAFVDAYLNLGTALAKLDHYDEALVCYDQAATLDPRSAEAHFNAGNAFQALDRHAEAVASFENALALRPNYAEAHINLGSMVGKLGNYASAESHYRQAVALRPNPTNLVCLGGSLGAQGRLDEEEGFYQRALVLDPTYADAHQNLAWLQLKRGDYARGWASFAKRWRKHDYEAIAVPGIAEWHGESLQGRRILIVGEQGFGDHFQFLRYARVLEQRGATVDVRVREPLVRLVARMPGVHRAFSGAIEHDYDFWVPMMSVPGCVGTELSTIPADLPYVFAESASMEAWRDCMDATDSVSDGNCRVGLVWAGSPTFGNDRYRSIALSNLDSLAGSNGIAWYALQRGAAHGQLADAPAAFRAHDFTASLHDFGDTAALVMNLDLVISVDTAVAHLAAALGKPVWLMLPANADWRWLENRGDSPWYPSMKLFRQTSLGDWTPVVKQVADELRSLRAGKHA
ncbi:tetratricopeptide (TPR) repeat protein [Paraburkholderia sp. GAS199]|uniref:tetratricopeptide repeat protein n=1 Tax=Paraburkholderia sp. GAS199 TaxID=3035126 RepID=UPI003D1A9DE9